MIDDTRDRCVRRLREHLSRVCPSVIQERVVDQALADLVEERSAYAPGVRRLAVTVHGTARLALALVLSVVLLRRQWRGARWWPAPISGREVAGWVTLLTLLVILRVAFTRADDARTWTLLPGFVLSHAVPLALPAAVLGLALVQRCRRVSTTLLLGGAAAVCSVLLTVVAPSLVTSSAGNSAAPKPRVGAAVGSVVLRAAAWQGFEDRRRAEWRRYSLHGATAIASFCVLVPLVGTLAAARFRLPANALLALTAVVVVQEFVFRWSTAIPPPMITVTEAIRALWLPHLLLAAAACGLAVSLVRARSVRV
jgi:hypothetical protein